MSWLYGPLLPGAAEQQSAGVTYAYARPASDVSAGSWTTHTGATTNLYAAIDETAYDDADYVKSSQLTTGQSDTLEVALEALTDPSSSSNHVVRYRYFAFGNTTTDLTVSLRQGASTQIAAWSHSNVGASGVTGEQTLSGAEADAITDYSDLRLRFVASA